MKRAHAAMELGVDAIMIIGVREQEDFQYFRREIKEIPMVALAGFGPLGISDFQAVGHQIVIFPLATIGSALMGIYSTYKSVKENGHLGLTEAQDAQVRELINTLLAFEQKWEVESATTEKTTNPAH